MTIEAPQHVSNEGLRFIGCREALVTIAYADGKNADGSPKFSIGFGSQHPIVREGDTISIENAFKRLRADTEARDKVLNAYLKVIIPQSMYDAVSSLYFQRGTRALYPVIDLFNEGKDWEAMWAFTRFNSGADGAPTKGHSLRRVREMMMGLDSYYGDISQVKVFEGNPRVVTPRLMPFPENI